MEWPVRVRVEFEDRRLLAKPQRSEGLKRCWILLKPELSTIADLSSHLTHIFSLHRTCPHGVILSMDDFVLPLFESTCILKDKDIIRVKKKASHVKEVIKNGDDGYFIQQTEVVQKQPVVSSNKLLAIEEFKEDLVGCKSKDEDIACTLEENTIHAESPIGDIGEMAKLKRKRENSDILQGSKRKKAKATGTETSGFNGQVAEKCCRKKRSCSLMGIATHRSSCNKEKLLKRRDRRKKAKETGTEKPGFSGQVAEDYCTKKKQSCFPMGVASYKNSNNEDKPLKQRDRSDILLASQDDESAKKIPGSVSREESDDRVEEIVRRDSCEPHADAVMNKGASRSARRKKDKRKWLKEMLRSPNKEHINSEVPTNDTAKKTLEHQKTDQNNEAGDEIVPIMVRPGHIRFESPDAECLVQQAYRPVVTMQWNGTTSKKKGQKWGMERTSKRADDNACTRESIQKLIAGDGNLTDKNVNYESLPPISRLPKVNDVIAYRMVELSSTWCPELSSFQVGKVQSYDSVSLKIVLVPVPEYPIFLTEKGPDNMEPNVSSYKEDGSLEIDYPSLVDVRLFKANTSEETAADSCRRETVEEVSSSNSGETSAGNNVTQMVASRRVTPVNNWELALANSANTRKAETPISTFANVALADSSLGDKSATCTERVASHMATPVNNWESVLANSTAEGKATTPNEKRPGMGWEQIDQALNQKKAELSDKDGWGNWTPNKDTTAPPWSYRALRRSAIGPTVAFLRSKSRRY